MNIVRTESFNTQEKRNEDFEIVGITMRKCTKERAMSMIGEEALRTVRVGGPSKD